MGRLVLVSGSSGSGKSLFAERLAAHAADDRFYIATMRPVTEDNRRRIAKHRRQRAGLGFTTFECPLHVSGAPVSAGSAVLLEDLSNLLANVLFESGGTADQVWDDLLGLQQRCLLLVVVTISGLSPHGCDAETAAYIDALNGLNERLLRRADAAVRMCCHEPVVCKGDLSDVFKAFPHCSVDIQHCPGSSV